MEYIEELSKYDPLNDGVSSSDIAKLHAKIQELTKAINQIIRSVAILID